MKVGTAVPATAHSGPTAREDRAAVPAPPQHKQTNKQLLLQHILQASYRQ